MNPVKQPMQESMENTEPKRSSALDGMKGLMILAIIFYYYYQNYLPGGFLAVNAFFAIGGYLAFRHNKHMFHRDKVQYHFGARVARLWKPMFAMIVGTSAYIYLFAPTFLKNIRHLALASLFFVNNDYQLLNQQSYFVQSVNPSPFVHLWYVSIYLQLILLSIIIRRIFSKSNFLRMQECAILILLSVLSAVGMAGLYWLEQDPSHVYYLVSTRMFAFFFGGALSYLCDGQLVLELEDENSRLPMQLLGIGSLVSLIAMMVYFTGVQNLTYYFGMQLFTMATLIFMVAGLFDKTILNGLLRFRLFTAIGRRSYSYYLWFYPVHLILPAQLTMIEDSWVQVGIQFVVIALLAEISYRLFEVESWKIPFGQRLRLSAVRQFFKSEQKLLQKIMGTLISVIYLIGIGIAIVAIIQSVEGTSQTAQELEATIRRNQELVQQTTEEMTTATVDTNRQNMNRGQVAKQPITFVGDSILLAAADKIQELFPNATIDGHVGRQLYSSNSLAAELSAQGKLSNTVVTILGTNGTLADGQLDDYIRSFGAERQIYLVTVSAPVNWRQDVNHKITNSITRFPNVHIIDWASFAENHAEWFYEDQIHPNAEGATELANFILEKIAENQ